MIAFSWVDINLAIECFENDWSFSQHGFKMTNFNFKINNFFFMCIFFLFVWRDKGKKWGVWAEHVSFSFLNVSIFVINRISLPILDIVSSQSNSWYYIWHLCFNDYVNVCILKEKKGRKMGSNSNTGQSKHKLC